MSSLAYWRLYSLEDVNTKARNSLPSSLQPDDQQISCWQARWGLVRFSDSLALPRASGLGNLTSWGQAEIRISYDLLAKSCQFEMCGYESLSGGFSLAEKVARVAKDELESGRECEDQKLKSSTICLPPPPAHFQCLHLFNSRNLCDYYHSRFLSIEKSFKNGRPTPTHSIQDLSIYYWRRSSTTKVEMCTMANCRAGMDCVDPRFQVISSPVMWTFKLIDPECVHI